MPYSTIFWNRIAKKYAGTPVPSEEIYQRKLAETQKYLAAGKEVLEFGCGTGTTALAHAPRVKSYLAIDSSKAMIDIATEILNDTDINNLTFSVSSLEELSAPDGSFDVILGLSILHLLDDPDAAINKVQRLLKPGGLFVSNTACIMDFMPWFRYIAPMATALTLIPKIRFFSRNELITMLEKNGFEPLFELERESPKQACFLISRKSN